MLGWGHWVGCIFLLLSFLREATSDGLQDSHFMQLHQYTRIAEPTDSEWWGNYLAAYYKAFNRNYEGSMPERLEEFVLILFVAAGLLAMKSYVIGSFFKLQETKKDLAREVQQLLSQAQLVCDSLDLPPSIRKSIRQHMMFQWSKARDVGNREVVLKTFAPDLQKKVKEQIYLPIIQANEKLFNGASSDFMLQIIDQLEVVVLQPSEFLFCENDAPQDLCFLETGTLMITSQEQLVRYVRSDRPNEPTAVGEVSFVLKMPHLYSVRSRSGVESSILKITTDNFELIMSNLDSDRDQLLHNVAQSMKLSMNGTDLKKGAVMHDGQDETEFFQHMRESVRQMLLSRTAHMSITFINAAAEGNMEQVELLLRKRVSIDTANCDGRTAMHVAAAEGRENVIKALVKAEGNVNLQDRWKGTPLRDAVLGKFSAVTEILIDQNADLNLEDPATALCDAASSGNLMALKELIEVKIDPNSGDYDLRTALHLAASEGKLEVISFLLDSRANPNFKDRWGGTALEDAIQNNHSVAAQLIFSKKGGLRQELAAGWLCDAASAGNILKLQQLIENSVDVNISDYDARTALHLAATEGQLLAVSFLISSARAFTSPQDRWRSTPLQDAVRAGHIDCVRLLAFAGASLGDSATDEDRTKLQQTFGEDFSSPETWGEVQKFQRRMNDLQQRVARLLISVAKGRARPEVFDAEASTKFNRQLICAIFKQCPQLADGMLSFTKMFQTLEANAVAPMQTFLAFLQDSIDCMRHSRWWTWYAKQNQKEERSERHHKKGREAKVEKSTGMITKLMVAAMGICNQLAIVVMKAAKEIHQKVNWEVNTRRITSKEYRLDEGAVVRRRERHGSGMDSVHKSSASRRSAAPSAGQQRGQGRRGSVSGSSMSPSHRAPSVAGRSQGSRRSKKGEEMTEDPREPGNHPGVCEICVECIFRALGWDVDWTAPASANYGLNAGAIKKKMEEVAALLEPAQGGAAHELTDSLLEIHAPPLDAAAWREERRARCCVDTAKLFCAFSKDEYLKPMSFPLALELAMFAVLAVVRTAPVNMDIQPSREKTLQRTDFLFLRSGLELAEQEVRGDIAKTRKEVIKQREMGGNVSGKKVMNIGARFGGNRIEPVSVGRILATQKDLPADDLSAIIDVQDGHVHVTAKLDDDDSDDEGRRRADKKITRRKDDVHILTHESCFGVMSSERFQDNLLRYLLDFPSLQVDSIDEDERKRAVRKVPMGMESPETEEEDDNFYAQETLSSGEVIWLDEEILLDFEEMGSQAVASEASTGSLTSYERAQQLASPGDIKRSPTSNFGRRTPKRDAGGDDKKNASILRRCFQWLQSRAAVCGGKEDQEAKLRQKMTWKFRELDEDGEGLALADVATLLTDVLGHALDRDAMLRLAANVYDTLERSEQELLQLTELQECLETVTTGYDAMVKRQRKHSSQGQRGEDRSWPWVQRLAGYVMPMDSPYLLVWDFLKNAAAIYYLMEVPMRFCIINFDKASQQTALAWFIVNIAMDVFMFANLPLNFLRSYEEGSGIVVRDFEQIRRNYLLGAFSWDLIACLPFDIFADPSLSSERTYATWRLLKLIHLRHLYTRRNDSKSSDRQEHGFMLTTLMVVLQLFVLLHFMACIFWYIGNGWPSLQELRSRQSDTDVPGWFMVYEGMNVQRGSISQPEVPVLNQYLLAIYIMVVVVTNDSNSLASPSSWPELFWLLVSFVISVAVMGHIDGTLVGKVISQDESVVEQRVMRARIDTFIKNSGLPPDLVEQIRMSAGADGDSSVNVLASSNKTQKAADVRVMESVLANLSYSLLQRVGRRVFLKWLQALPIFKDCSDPFLLHLATSCRLLTSSAGAFVCRAGEPTSYFVVLKSGSAQLRDMNSDEVDRVDERGTALCDISCLFGLRHEISIVSEEDSVFIKCPLEQLNNALALYPKDHEAIHNNVLKLTPDPSHEQEGNEDVIDNQGMVGMWGEDDEDMAKSQASHTSRRRRKRKEGGVDLVAELNLHDLSLEGVAKVRKLIKQFQKTQEQERIGDFIAYAAQGKLEQMEAMLRSNKVSVSCVNWDMRTALHVAVSHGHGTIVEKLIMEYLAPLTVQDRFGHTPLDDAVRERHAEVAEFLIEASAEFKGGVSAAVQLCEAAANGETAQLELLVDVIGVDPNLGDYDARTALHLAASNGHLETITKMLEFGNLDLSPLDRFGQTPLDDAIRHEHVAVQRLLKAEGAQMGKVEFGVALCEAASQNDLGKIRQMIEAGVRAGMADYDYRTALHLACSNGHLETCVFLLREGKVDPNPLDRFLNTPMDDAVRHEQHDVVQLLVKYRGRPSQDEELQGGVRSEFINMMEEEGNRKDADKLEKELKTNGFAEVLEKLVKLRSDIENEVHQFIASATNIRYDICKILHMATMLGEDSVRGKMEMEEFKIGFQDETTTVQRLRFLMDKDIKSFDATAAKILQHLDEEVYPFLNNLNGNHHTKGLVTVLMPQITKDMDKLASVLRHVKALLPQLMGKLSTPSLL
ncbi:SKOR, partial [Symbiodinium sp. CCMP2456]